MDFIEKVVSQGTPLEYTLTFDAIFRTPLTRELGVRLPIYIQDQSLVFQDWKFPRQLDNLKVLLGRTGVLSLHVTITHPYLTQQSQDDIGVAAQWNKFMTSLKAIVARMKLVSKLDGSVMLATEQVIDIVVRKYGSTGIYVSYSGNRDLADIPEVRMMRLLTLVPNAHPIVDVTKGSLPTRAAKAIRDMREVRRAVKTTSGKVKICWLFFSGLTKAHAASGALVREVRMLRLLVEALNTPEFKAEVEALLKNQSEHDRVQQEKKAAQMGYLHRQFLQAIETGATLSEMIGIEVRGQITRDSLLCQHKEALAEARNAGLKAPLKTNELHLDAIPYSWFRYTLDRKKILGFSYEGMALRARRMKDRDAETKKIDALTIRYVSAMEKVMALYLQMAAHLEC